jgi:hypothetical protein
MIIAKKVYKPKTIPPCSSDSCSTIYGEITYKDGEAFEAKAAALTGYYRVILEPPGGNAIAGMRIGEQIRLKGWGTYVLDRCFSACAMAWLGGVAREMMSDAKVGFHQVSVNG